MASPPYRAPGASPPYPANTSLPRPPKRPSLVTTLGSVKRRKQSSFSTTSSSHPLRQTSFPPEEAQNYERSPSVESDFTTITGGKSAIASTAGGRKGLKGKGRRKDTTDGSIRSGAKDGTGRSRDGRSKSQGIEEDDDDLDGEGDGDAEEEDVQVDEGGRVDKAAEQKKMAVLIDAFTPDQSERYNTYRRVKLKKETVRRITNQTLSQSVPPSIITTLSGLTKVFIGTLVERAREIQAQNHHEIVSKANTESIDTFLNGESDKKKYLGPLVPDDLREALRRYRKDGEGGAAGVEGRTVGLGLPGSGAARLNGKRLFS